MNAPHNPSSPEQSFGVDALGTNETSPEIEAGPDPPTIYVASLSDYNAGTLHGTWIDATKDMEDIDTEIYDMLSRSQEPNPEEIAIHDYQGFGAWQPSEYENLETITTVAQAILEHGEAVTHWIDYLGERPDRAIASFQEAYCGRWETMQDYAEELADSIGVELTVDPPSWQHYARIDYSAVARDMEIELYSDRGSDGSLHVFDPGQVE